MRLVRAVGRYEAGDADEPDTSDAEPYLLVGT
jgi:hypothetical protein